MKLLCSICARGGSQGLKNKNVAPLLGKPLIAHSIEQAESSKLFSEIVVSSDSEDILSVSKKLGVSLAVQRPSELASDTAPKVPAIRHCAIQAEAIFKTKYDYFVDLDCTSPLRNVEDILRAVDLMLSSNADNLFSVCESKKSPYFNMVERGSDGSIQLSKKLDQGIFRRQDAPTCYDINGSIYIWKRSSLLESTNDTVFFKKTEIYVMPKERSVDIDSIDDFNYVEYLMNNGAAQKQRID